MDIKEFIESSTDFDETYKADFNNSELQHFVTLWVRSRLPEAFKELESNFRKIEPQVYNYRESQADYDELPF